MALGEVVTQAPLRVVEQHNARQQALSHGRAVVDQSTGQYELTRPVFTGVVGFSDGAVRATVTREWKALRFNYVVDVVHARGDGTSVPVGRFEHHRRRDAEAEVFPAIVSGNKTPLVDTSGDYLRMQRSVLNRAKKDGVPVSTNVGRVREALDTPRDPRSTSTVVFEGLDKKVIEEAVVGGNEGASTAARRLIEGYVYDRSAGRVVEAPQRTR